MTIQTDKRDWRTVGARVPPEIHEQLEAVAARRCIATGTDNCRKAHIVAEAIIEKLEREAV